MNCPKCNGNLKEEKYKSILVDKCEECEVIILNDSKEF